MTGIFTEARGQAAVETIALMPLFIAVVFIMINIFLITYNRFIVMEASIEGAAAGVAANHEDMSRNKINKQCSEETLNLLNEKLINAKSEKPKIHISGEKIKVEAVCRYRLLIPWIDRFIDTEIELKNSCTRLLYSMDMYDRKAL